MKTTKITTKIRLLVAIAIVAGVAASGFLIVRLKTLGAAYEDILSGVAHQDAAREMQLTFKKQVQAWKDLLIRGSDPAALQQYSEEFHAHESSVSALAKALMKAELGPEVRGRLERFDQAHRDMGNKYAAGLQAFTQAKGLNMREVDQAVKGQDRAPTDTVDQIVDLLAKRSAALRQAEAEAVSREIWTVSLALLAAFAGIGIASTITVRRLTAALQESIFELARGAEQVASAAGQVSSSSQSLAQGSSEQAASLEETSASTEEINSMARQNSEHSHAAADLVTESQQKFVETNQSLEQMVVAMGEINTQSDRISKIIKVIDEIAFQTNILALNAAVEAARAGEAGMGFAVVADEVRSLAQRCAQAARDTAELIEESIAKSNAGKMKVDRVTSAIRSITDQSAKVKTLVDAVNVGSQEQARGIEQIGRAVIQMEQVTQRTAATAEEGASAAEELNAQSEGLKDIVERLSAMVGGATAGGSRVRRQQNRAVSAHQPAATPKRRSDSGSGLKALNTAVNLKSNRFTAEPAVVGTKAHHNAFPDEREQQRANLSFLGEAEP